MGEIFSDSDLRFMGRALQRAARAEEEGEVPVGAFLTHEEVVLGEGWNRPITLNDPSAHAEILAMRQAGQSQGNYRLPGSTLYVTLEPCPMCVGAMLHARIERLVYAATDPKTGALGGAFSLPDVHAHNHEMQIEGGLMAEQASEMLRAFFRKRR